MSEPFFRSFLAAEPGSRSLLAPNFRSREQRIAHARRAAERALAPGLVPILREQNEGLPPSDARARNVEALARGGTAAVVTGQQLGLFLGPLYTLYKAATAIEAARRLEQESGVRCVPVFWLPTEDHDFPEIDHCHVLLPDGSRKTLTLPDRLGSTGERVSVKQRVLGEECRSLAASLEDRLRELPFAPEVLRLVREHYRPGHTLVRAFVGLLSAFFADEGLIVFDPRDATVARIAAPIYRRALVEAEEVAHSLLERIAALERAGFATQVHVRPGSPLFFFHQGGPEAPRFRLHRDGAAWTLVGASEAISSEELLRLLEVEPLRFSSSALLRPIVQDYLLPSAAYVGGPAEVSYFAQLPPLYQLFGIAMPLVVPRARFRWLEPKAASLLSRLKLTASDLEESHDALRRKTGGASIADYPSPEAVGEDLMNDFSSRLDRFQGIAQSLDPGLLKAVDRTRATVARAAQRLCARYGRSLLEKDRVLVERLGRLQGLLFPGGVPQERWDSFPYFAARYGPAFKQKLFSSLDPFAGEVRDIQL